MKIMSHQFDTCTFERSVSACEVGIWWFFNSLEIEDLLHFTLKISCFWWMTSSHWANRLMIIAASLCVFKIYGFSRICHLLSWKLIKDLKGLNKNYKILDVHQPLKKDWHKIKGITHKDSRFVSTMNFKTTIRKS